MLPFVGALFKDKRPVCLLDGGLIVAVSQAEDGRIFVGRVVHAHGDSRLGTTGKRIGDDDRVRRLSIAGREVCWRRVFQKMTE